VQESQTVIHAAWQTSQAKETAYHCKQIQRDEQRIRMVADFHSSGSGKWWLQK